MFPEEGSLRLVIGSRLRCSFSLIIKSSALLLAVKFFIKRMDVPSGILVRYSSHRFTELDDMHYFD